MSYVIKHFPSCNGYKTSNPTLPKQNTIKISTEQEARVAIRKIEDADVAQEMSDFLKFKLLTEVALTMVSQANQIPQMVSKLLQS
ncbi:hypothetical protein EXW50_08545 [Bacillus mycoides]|nr:hypothetical protein [Bacillus mycoides]QWG71734.1 hypothetical protein EXW63_05840 [Bacillus mycoides]QWH22452.1 hypothetical protein EXW50_08545 [Bacillus mycoides]